MQGIEGGTHDWVSFMDDDQNTWLFDLTFLTSSWTCIFGRGCQGVVADAETGAAQGCCSHSAHLYDDDDAARVAHFASRLTDDQWQFRDVVDTEADLFVVDEDGDTLTTKVDDACIFLNRPDFPTGAGCALHYGAMANDERPLDWKPAACWQLPLRLEENVDAAGRATYIVRAWYRGDWGDGGKEFSWWCTDSPEPLVGPDAVYVTMRDELIELVGAEPYQLLVDHIASTRRRSSDPVPVSIQGSAGTI